MPSFVFGDWDSPFVLRLVYRLSCWCWRSGVGIGLGIALALAPAWVRLRGAAFAFVLVFGLELEVVLVFARAGVGVGVRIVPREVLVSEAPGAVSLDREVLGRRMERRGTDLRVTVSC